MYRSIGSSELVQLYNMAPQASSISALRAASFRISSASKNELPHVVAYVSQSLISCKDLLSAPEPAQKDSDAAVVLHRFNTQLSALLQDRTAEGRWAAIVLVKAAIEAGGWETLRKSNAWVRGLLNILKKPDPPITRCLCIIVLTRIFMLTWDFPTLIREITTPALPTFVSTCLSNLTSRPLSQDELRTTLECFAQLIPRHPTIFRTHQDAVGRLLKSIFDASKASVPADVKDLASRVSILLHQCEPKGGAGEKWEKSLVATVKSAHGLADKTFIGIEEDWQSVASNNINKHSLKDLYQQSQSSKNASERPVQHFITSGSDGLLNHLRLLAGYFSIATPANVTVSLGQVTDLLTRLFAITISQSASKTSIKFNRDVSREERDAVAQVLPEIHLASLELLSAILDRYGNQLTPTLQSFIDQLLWIFHAESSDRTVKTAVYTVMKTIVDLVGPSMTKQTIISLRKLIAACCEDLLPSKAEKEAEQTTPGNGNKPAQTIMNADTFLKQPKSANLAVQPAQFPQLQTAAWNLLPSLLSRLPAKHIPVAVRSQMDRVAVITRHKDAMVASTLNAPPSEGGRAGANSLLPLLAREYASDSQVEALLRPRMPVIETGRRTMAPGTDFVPEEDEDENEDAEMSEAEDDEAERESVSNSPDVLSQPSNEVKETAQADQTLITEALDAYMSGPVPRAQPAAETEMVVETQEKETDRPAGKATDVLGKRTRETSPAESDKRPKAVSTAAAAADDSDDDDDFDIPQLVMGGDSDDEEEEV